MAQHRCEGSPLMTCAPPASVARARRAAAADLPRALRRWLQATLPRLRQAVAQSAATCAADADRKHFTSFAHTSLLLYHGLSGGPSLRQSYERFGACAGLVQ